MSGFVHPPVLLNKSTCMSNFFTKKTKKSNLNEICSSNIYNIFNLGKMAAEGRCRSSFVWCFSPIFSFENGSDRFTPECFLDPFLMNSYLHDKEVQHCGQCVFLLHFTFLMGGILFISFDCDSLLNMFFKCFIVLFTFRSFTLSYKLLSIESL